MYVQSSIIHNSQTAETTQCPSADEWINKMAVYYLAIKRNEILIQPG